MMFLVNPEMHLRLAGLLLLLLAGIHVFLPKRLLWREELGRLSLVNRQIFIVHCLFIILMLIFMGVLSLVFAPLMLERTRLASLVGGALALFWFLRLLVQLFVYSPSLWRGNRFNTVVHVVFSCLWAYFAGVFGMACVISSR